MAFSSRWVPRAVVTTLVAGFAVLLKPVSVYGQSVSWSGLYVGAHLGNGTGTADTTFTPLPDAASFKSVKPITSADALEPNPKGAVFGGQGGYNFQAGHLVVGAEVVFSSSRMKGTVISKPIIQNDGSNFDTAICPLFVPPICHPAADSRLTAGEETKWMMHIRARGGVQVGKVLIYAAIGPTVASVEYSATTHFGPSTFYVEYPADKTETRHGIHYGAGGEFAASRKVSVFGEFLGYDLKAKTLTTDPLPAQDPDFAFQVSNSWLTKATVLRGGVNFRF